VSPAGWLTGGMAGWLLDGLIGGLAVEDDQHRAYSELASLPRRHCDPLLHCIALCGCRGRGTPSLSPSTPSWPTQGATLQQPASQSEPGGSVG
jgi:hypothetical protein